MEVEGAGPFDRRGGPVFQARVAVVQSREALARTTAQHLLAAGIEPVVVTDGDAAVRLVVTDPPDLVLLDLTLPALDGWCVLATLGARPGPPVVAYAPSGDAARAMTLGASACVHDRGAVVGALRRLLEPSPV
jgi:DNA-binding response OmpR family regulator